MDQIGYESDQKLINLTQTQSILNMSNSYEHDLLKRESNPIHIIYLLNKSSQVK